MKLVEVIANLESFDQEKTIYAIEPWTPNSEAVVAYEDDNGDPPIEVKGMKVAYFIEVFIAKEVLDGFSGGDGETISHEDQCLRLIQYAIKDA